MVIPISRDFQSRHRNSCKECLQNFMEIDLELTEKSAKNTQRWWKLTATIVTMPYSYRMTLRVHYRPNAQYQRQHCTLQASCITSLTNIWYGRDSNPVWVSSNNRIEWAIGAGELSFYDLFLIYFIFLHSIILIKLGFFLWKLFQETNHFFLLIYWDVIKLDVSTRPDVISRGVIYNTGYRDDHGV